MQPLAFSIGWKVGTAILLKFGANLEGALLLAIELQDTDTVAMILETDCPLSVHAVWGGTEGPSLLHYADAHCPFNQKIRDIIVKRFVRDMRCIRDLALEALSQEEQESLGLHLLDDTMVLDEKVFEVGQALGRHNIRLPHHLWTGNGCHRSIYGHLSSVWPGNGYHGSTYGKTSLESNECGPTIRDTLYDNGFRSVDARDEGGNTPLYKECRPFTSEVHWDVIKWFLDKGGSPRYHDDTGRLRSGIHGLAKTFSMRSEQFASPCERILQQVSERCGATSLDDCRCYCSSYGCIPVAVVSKGTRLDRGSATVLEWLRLTNITPVQREVCYAEVCRAELFGRLGMAHTCCHSHQFDPITDNDLKEGSEWRELRDEDFELSEALDAYLKLYNDLRKEHAGSLSSFWDGWWQVIDILLPLGKDKGELAYYTARKKKLKTY